VPADEDPAAAQLAAWYAHLADDLGPHALDELAEQSTALMHDVLAAEEHAAHDQHL